MLQRSIIERQARELRRAEIQRLAHEFSSWLTDFLRTRHEAMLRRRPRNLRLRPVNAMPA